MSNLAICSCHKALFVLGDDLKKEKKKEFSWFLRKRSSVLIQNCPRIFPIGKNDWGINVARSQQLSALTKF
jgi:hypothetical protein